MLLHNPTDISRQNIQFGNGLYGHRTIYHVRTTDRLYLSILFLREIFIFRQDQIPIIHTARVLRPFYSRIQNPDGCHIIGIGPIYLLGKENRQCKIYVSLPYCHRCSLPNFGRSELHKQHDEAAGSGRHIHQRRLYTSHPVQLFYKRALQISGRICIRKRNPQPQNKIRSAVLYCRSCIRSI